MRPEWNSLFCIRLAQVQEPITLHAKVGLAERRSIGFTNKNFFLREKFMFRKCNILAISVAIFACKTPPVEPVTTEDSIPSSCSSLEDCFWSSARTKDAKKKKKLLTSACKMSIGAPKRLENPACRMLRNEGVDIFEMVRESANPEDDCLRGHCDSLFPIILNKKGILPLTEEQKNNWKSDCIASKKPEKNDKYCFAAPLDFDAREKRTLSLCDKGNAIACTVMGRQFLANSKVVPEPIQEQIRHACLDDSYASDLKKQLSKYFEQNLNVAKADFHYHCSLLKLENHRYDCSENFVEGQSIRGVPDRSLAHDSDDWIRAGQMQVIRDRLRNDIVRSKNNKQYEEDVLTTLSRSDACVTHYAINKLSPKPMPAKEVISIRKDDKLVLRFDYRNTNQSKEIFDLYDRLLSWNGCDSNCQSNIEFLERVLEPESHSLSDFEKNEWSPKRFCSSGKCNFYTMYQICRLNSSVYSDFVEKASESTSFVKKLWQECRLSFGACWPQEMD